MFCSILQSILASSGNRAGVFSLLFCALISILPAAQANGVALVAAASDLQFALVEIAEKFEQRSGHRLNLSFGSSGNFARQIRQGAPFEIYFSADEDYVFDLARAGFTRDEGRLYAIGRLVVIAPHNSELRVDAELAGLGDLLASGKLGGFAIANPEHAPYGQRAAEALAHFDLWQAIETHLVFGENVSQAAQFAVSGNAQGGLIAYSLALAKAVSARGSYALIPAEVHSPLRQRMVMLKNAGAVAEQFYDFVGQPEVQAIFRRYGFDAPAAGS